MDGGLRPRISGICALVDWVRRMGNEMGEEIVNATSWESLGKGDEREREEGGEIGRPWVPAPAGPCRSRA